MCGLIGMAGVLGHNDDKAFQVLLMLDVVRGAHSTGALFVPKKGAANVVKVSGDPFGLLGSVQFTKGLQGFNKVLLGHNRYATRGAHTKLNAHPFDFDTLVGAHNGTLTTQHLLDDHKDYVVDSENLFAHMENNGIAHTIARCGGAYALTWYDKENDTINFLRNKERPLHYTFSESNTTVYWASEKWMLEVALARNSIKHGLICEFEVDKHYSMPADDVSDCTITYVAPYKPAIPAPSKYKGKYIPPANHGVVANIGNDYYQHTRGGNNRQLAADIDIDGDESASLLGHGGQLLTKTEWERSTNNCCSWCSSPAVIEDHAELVWLDNDNYVCPDCSSLEAVQEYLIK